MVKIFTNDIVEDDPEIVYKGMMIELKDKLNNLITTSENQENFEEFLDFWERDPIHDLGFDKMEAEKFGIENISVFNSLLGSYQKAYEGLYYIKNLKNKAKTCDAFEIVINFIKQ